MSDPTIEITFDDISQQALRDWLDSLPTITDASVTVKLLPDWSLNLQYSQPDTRHFPDQPADLQKEVVAQPDNNPTPED